MVARGNITFIFKRRDKITLLSNSGGLPCCFPGSKKKITLLKIGFNTLYYLSGSPINREYCNIFGMKDATFQLFRTQLTVPSL